MPHPIVDAETRLLTQVRTVLLEEPPETPPKEADLVAELVRIRDELNAAKVEDQPAMLQQYEHLHAWLDQIREARERPQVDPDSPYFAHLELEEDGQRRTVCLGKATRITRGVRIVDWRHAPVSRVFYKYQQGELYEEELGDHVVEGEVLARRTVTIQLGKLLRIDAPEGTFVHEDTGWVHHEVPPHRLSGGERAALSVYQAEEVPGRRLGTDLQGHRRRVDKRLPDIAGLIDPEQFELIAKPGSGFVVIRGTAGSGKTTVALHRIAYLAYQDPVFDSPATLFLVFSPALKDYVSHVLPSLGVNHVEVRDFRSWATALRIRHFPRLPKEQRELTPALVTRAKLHPAMMVALERQVANVPGPANVEQATDDWLSLLTDLTSFRSALEDLDPDAFSEADLERIASWSRDRADELLARLDGDREVEVALDAEDDPLLLRAFQLRVGPLRHPKGGNLRYRHVAVDEVQDFSPLEIRVLLACLDQHQSITLAGDTQQHVMQDAGFQSWADFFRHLGLGGVAVNTLKVAYRSGRAIVDFAQHVLGPLREDEEGPMVTREGPPVELFRFTDHGAAVAFLADALKALQADEALASVAVLAADPTVTAIYHDGLRQAEVPRLRRVTAHDFTFAPGVELTEIDQVKGLEFDYVVLLQVDGHLFPDHAAARRLLHVGATRAVHQLWLTVVGEPSPLIREALPVS